MNTDTMNTAADQDFVRAGETNEYYKTSFLLMKQLAPEGILEQAFADEIMSATWRLRRCRIAEADLADRTTADPMLDQDAPGETVSKDQKSIDRARAQAHGILRRSMTELRKLQTERTIRATQPDLEIPGLADTRQVVNALKFAARQRPVNPKAPEPDPAPESSFCKQPADSYHPNPMDGLLAELNSLMDAPPDQPWPAE